MLLFYIKAIYMSADELFSCQSPLMPLPLTLFLCILSTERPVHDLSQLENIGNMVQSERNSPRVWVFAVPVKASPYLG